MRKRLYIIVLAVSVLLTATGCLRKDAVKVYNVTDFSISLQSSPRVNLVVSVENTSHRNITISDAALELTDSKGVRVAKVIVGNDLVLPKQSLIDLPVPLKLSVENPLKALALLGDIERNMAAVFVSGEATVKAGCFRKRIHIDRMSLNEFINRYGNIPVEDRNY